MIAPIALVAAVLSTTLVSAPVDLAGGWRVRADPANAGLAGRWDAAGLNDSRWEAGAPSRSAAGEPVWLRRWIDVPEGWPRVVLVLEGIAGRADLWVNGAAGGRDLARRRASGGAVVLDLARPAAGKPRCLLAVRLAPDASGPGTLGAARLVSDPSPWLPDVRDRIGFLASESPGLPWPSWARGEGAAWAAFAEPGGTVEGRIGWRGEIEGGDGGFAVSCWLLDRATEIFYAAPAVPCRLRLDGRYLPIPSVTAQAGKTFEMTVSAWPSTVSQPVPMSLAIGEVVVTNASDRPRAADLFIAVQPFSARGAILPVRSLRYDRATQAFWVNGRPGLLLAGTPDAAGVATFGTGLAPGEGEGLVQAAARGELPPAQAVDDAEGLAAGAALYHLKLQPFGSRTQSFRIFLSGTPAVLEPPVVRAIRDVDRKAGARELESRWQKLIAGKERIFLRVPDKTAQDAFYASVGHILVALAGGRVMEADRGLAAAALLRAGHAATATALAGAAAGWAVVPAAGAATATMISDGEWRPGDSLEAAWAAARTGDGEGAGSVLAWWLAHPTTPGAFAWSQRADPGTGRYAGGDLPDPRAAALYVCALRDMLVREDGDALVLAPALPEKWMRPGDVVDVRRIPTYFGILPGFVLASAPSELALRRLTAERIANRGHGLVIDPRDLARPPGGFRWRIPGTRRIRQLIVDGMRLREIPPDRTLVLPESFREVRVTW